jgi:anti-sigma B factor antagonist
MESEPTRIDEHGIRPPAAFSIEDERVGPATAVRLSGEVDVAAGAALRARVDAAAAGPLVFDLAAVTFVDSSGLRELLRARMECDRRGGRLLLAGVPPVVVRLLDLTGTASMFEIAPTLGAVLARVAAED